MTQISGEIYQMKNAAGTLNRFPRTVLEAVIGLPSYLQQQFGALADIYMPIEGINQANPNQEFVYRKTPNTIKAKALTLDKIKGKTLAWNQLCDDPNASDTTKWICNSGTKSLSGGKVHIVENDNAWGEVYPGNSPAIIIGHTYYIKGETRQTAGTGTIMMELPFSVGGGGTLVGDKRVYSAVGTAIRSNCLFQKDAPSNTGVEFDILGLNIFDLTLLYGSEIDGMTDAQILAKYEADFGTGYHAYNPGALISNDAESLETVGFNQWDEEWVNGIIDTSTGEVTTGNVVVSANFIPVQPGATYCYYCKAGKSASMFLYGANKEYLGASTIIGTWASGATRTIPSNCYYIKFSPWYSDYGSTYNHDICINLSDPAKNGTYEPYRKSTMQLGLNSFKVKSPNIWDEEWENGFLSNTGGGEQDRSNAIRSKNYIPCEGGVVYHIHGIADSYHGFRWYDENKAYIDMAESANADFNATAPANAKYFRLSVYKYVASGTATYNHDICINVSNPGFNGKYFPHGVLTLTGGLKSAGSVYDEIVGTKLYRRVGRVDLGTLSWGVSYDEWCSSSLISGKKIEEGNSNGISSRYTVNGATSWSTGEFPYNTISVGSTLYGVVFHNDGATTSEAVTALMHGVMLYYELANVEVYDLAEPIPMSMQAGTTEARISPNADGLSAPFCADITYGMGATEYAETAGVALNAISTQYAEVAARLLTPRTIWGQSFDGSANITGPMSGVTNIDSLAYFDTTNGRIGIGITTPQYNLDVAGTFHAAGNSVFGGMMYVNDMEVKSIVSEYDYEWDSEINPIQCFEITEDGDASFFNVSVYESVKILGYYNGDHEFGTATLSYVYAPYDTSSIVADKSITAPSFIQSSDQRLKTNLSPIALTVEQIASAPAVEFNWVGNGQRGAGSIAQYWEEQLPYNVHRNGDLLTMEYGNIALISAIVCARKIQELEEQIKKLEAKIDV